MPRPMVTFALAVVSVLAPAGAASQQPYGSEQAAFEQVANAVENFRRQGTLEAAEQVLAAAERARDAFAAADAARDSRHERVHATRHEYQRTCDRSPDCSWRAPGEEVPPEMRSRVEAREFTDWLDNPYHPATIGQAAWDPLLRVKISHYQAVADYVDLVGIGGAEAARGYADNSRLYFGFDYSASRSATDTAFRINNTYLIRAHNLHGYAVDAHAALHRTVLDVVSRTAVAMSQAADRLADTYFGIGIDNVRAARGRLEAAVNGARGQEVERSSDRTDRALDSMLLAAREMMAALRTNLEARQRYEDSPDSPAPDGRTGGGTAPGGADTGSGSDADPRSMQEWQQALLEVVTMAEQGVRAAEAAANADDGVTWFRIRCSNAKGSTSQAYGRLLALTGGRSGFVPSPELAQEARDQVGDRIEDARRRIEAICRIAR